MRDSCQASFLWGISHLDSMWIYHPGIDTIFFAGLMLQTMVQKNKQDFEMALQKVSKEKKDEKNGKDRMLLAV